MSENNDSLALEALLKMGNYSAVFINQLDHLKNALHNDLHFHFNGGTFYLNETFISYLGIENLEADKNPEWDYASVFLDVHEKPILIENVKEFSLVVLDHRSRAVTKYFTQYQRLNNSRTVEAVVDVE